jgi:hypothetical protein
MDPLGFVDSMNLYETFACDPVNYVDRWGLDKVVLENNEVLFIEEGFWGKDIQTIKLGTYHPDYDLVVFESKYQFTYGLNDMPWSGVLDNDEFDQETLYKTIEKIKGRQKEAFNKGYYFDYFGEHMADYSFYRITQEDINPENDFKTGLASQAVRENILDVWAPVKLKEESKGYSLIGFGAVVGSLSVPAFKINPFLGTGTAVVGICSFGGGVYKVNKVSRESMMAIKASKYYSDPKNIGGFWIETVKLKRANDYTRKGILEKLSK